MAQKHLSLHPFMCMNSQTPSQNSSDSNTQHGKVHSHLSTEPLWTTRNGSQRVVWTHWKIQRGKDRDKPTDRRTERKTDRQHTDKQGDGREQKNYQQTSRQTNRNWYKRKYIVRHTVTTMYLQLTVTWSHLFPYPVLNNSDQLNMFGSCWANTLFLQQQLERYISIWLIKHSGHTSKQTTARITWQIAVLSWIWAKKKDVHQTIGVELQMETVHLKLFCPLSASRLYGLTL